MNFAIFNTACKLLLAGLLALNGSIAIASGNYLRLTLPKGVTFELPRNWVVLSNNQRITLDSFVEAQSKNSNDITSKSDLSFAANLYDDTGQTSGILNVRYYPQLELTQNDASRATSVDTNELDEALRLAIGKSMAQLGTKLLQWNGTKKVNLSNSIAFITDYQRTSIQANAPFKVRLVRIFNGPKSFTLTISYRVDQAAYLQSITDWIIRSIQI